MLKHIMPTLCAFVIGLMTPLYADQHSMPDCEAVQLEYGPTYTQSPDCTISWVQNNQLTTLIWQAVQDDFEPASLSQTADRWPALTSSRRPALIDVDQDGWLDIVAFTQVGMVNGTFDIFLYDPDSDMFKPSEPLYGHTLERDKAGYIVIAGRSGPGTILRFYTAADNTLTYRFELDPYTHDPSGTGFTCDVSTARSDALSGDAVPPFAAVPDDPELLAYYCATETPVTDPSRTVILQEDPSAVNRVPAQTVFYCRLDGGTHSVTITQSAQGLRYAYGPVMAEPDLVMDHTADQITVLPENGAGPSRFGDITFTNGAYEYVAYYSFELWDDDGLIREVTVGSPFPNDTFVRGLVVYKDGDVAAPVFHKSCQLATSYDVIRNMRHL